MIDESTAKRILHDFRIESSIESMEPLVRGTNHASVRLRVDGRGWVLKSLTDGQASRIGLARAVEVELEKSGFPVAPVRLTATGRALVAHEGRHYTLHEWVDGQQRAIADRDAVLAENPAFLREAGRDLGSLHQIANSADLAGLDAPATTGEMLLRGPHHAVRRIRRPRRQPPLLSSWHMLRLKREKTDFDQWIIRQFGGVATFAARLRDRSLGNPIDRSDNVVIHNDINWENLILDERLQLRALLDFDNVTRAPRVVEVGAAAVVLAGAERGRVAEFVAAYEEETRRSVDWAALELAMSMKCVQSILNSITTHLKGHRQETALLESWCRDLHSSLQQLHSR
ncbi:aminoglycoside phosphotransferase family protein [Ornithinimicrobium ciconiae]|uniref:Aminoglycoside phosphotransferase family protein n=1 Tax=Ornithinimicrobium ciconiae TaxID=2594265 RepID=A0A516G7C5_9MICO|nr:aminoglycoside phosphotransferase family protein [Ornithinimicrobium ciconiae]QDO87436.1 aminoglycoside phosphotransferase family protein [Ornithinimicrobium ciconiae]